ncbi:RCC1 repeat-containing protein [Corallococcus exiguus]|uniref:RCC1 domain-containing protein n=1 Tax=Corallococcus exiguus TaxID=83462 RepID=UPI001A903038|nr:RCC1 domain-containing protein [Corallococcus exiguus]MBN8472036.1 RCC1 repeat-containing protein [Corallococcus exiguus]
MRNESQNRLAVLALGLVLILAACDSQQEKAVPIPETTARPQAMVAGFLFNSWPELAGMTALPPTLEVGQATLVTAFASDADGDSLSYEWTASCAGTWADATSASPSFTPTALPPGGTCTLTVVVRDGRGGQVTGSMPLDASTSPTNSFPPEIVETFQSVTTIPAGGGNVGFRVRARDPQGGALSFTWTTSSGTLSTPTNTAATSEILWTAPSCVPTGTTATVTMTATNALGLSTSFAFTLQGATPCPTVFPILQLAAGGAFSVALKQDGTVWTWGQNTYGQLGNGTTTNRMTPGRVVLPTNVTEVVAGYAHVLALCDDGTVWAWGYNFNGAIGDGTFTDRTTPFHIQGLTGVTALAAGGYHSLALRADGTIWGWGDNSHGQLGTRAPQNPQMPEQINGITGATAIAAGWYHSVALKSDGTVWSWGENAYGQLGSPFVTDGRIPIQAHGLTNISSISAGTMHSLALKADGTVWAWGYNYDGQLGDGTETIRHTPIQTHGISDILAIGTSATSAHSIALKTDGTVWTWGYNYSGQLGDGTTTTRLLPVEVQGLTDVLAINAGGHNLALKTDGTAWTWGPNYDGQLGDGTKTNRLIPVKVQGLGD